MQKRTLHCLKAKGGEDKLKNTETNVWCLWD